MSVKTYIINGEPVEIRVFTTEEMKAEVNETAILLDTLDAILASWETDEKLK